MCQRTKRYIEKRIVHLWDEAATKADTERALIDRLVAELQAVLSTVEGQSREVTLEETPAPQLQLTPPPEAAPQ